MAEPKSRKPRMRKSAPTIREAAETARAKEQSAKPEKAHRAKSVLSKPFSKLKVPKNPVTPRLRKVLGKLAPSYFVNSWREVRQVTWPNRKETWRLTGAVFVFAIVFGALIFGVDKGLDEIFKKVILK